MGSNDRDGTCFGVQIVQRPVLFDRQLEDTPLVFDAICIFSNMLTRNRVLSDKKRGRRHSMELWDQKTFNCGCQLQRC